MDLRIIKTHKAIRDAFITLLSEQDYDSITIQDILDTALINRATFYKYYQGKSDLAGQMIADFKAEVSKALSSRLDTDNQGLQQTMACHSQNIFGLRQQMLALCKIRTKHHHLYQDMFDMMKQNFIDLAKQQPQFTSQPLANLDYQATMMATIFMASCQYYFEKNLPLPADLPSDWQQMIDIIKI